MFFVKINLLLEFNFDKLIIASSFITLRYKKEVLQNEIQQSLKKAEPVAIFNRFYDRGI